MDRITSQVQDPQRNPRASRISNAQAMMQRPPVPQHPGSGQTTARDFFSPMPLRNARASCVLPLGNRITFAAYTVPCFGLCTRKPPQTPRWMNQSPTSRRSPWCQALLRPRTATAQSCSRARHWLSRMTARAVCQHHPRVLRCVACVRQLRPSTNALAAIYPSTLLS